MPSSNRGAFGRGNGTITVIEEPVMRSYRRKAKIVFYVTWVITAVLAATVAASRWHPIIALLAGLAAGFITGAIAGTIVAAWPVIRAIWWWTPETILTGSLVYGWIELAGHTTLLIRLAATAAIVGVPAAIRPVRTRLHQVSWCLVTRHRIRTCFSEFIITNRTGSLPLILWARPTPVGERVWIWLRPGLSLDDLHNRLDKIAVACWASRCPGRCRLGVQRRLRPARHQAPRRAGRHHHQPAAGPDQVRHPRHRAGHDQHPGRAGPAPGPRQRRHRQHRTPALAGPAQAARPPQDASPGVTPGPGCQRRQRHHRLALKASTGAVTLPPGRQLPRATRQATHPPRRNPTALTGLGFPASPEEETRHDRPHYSTAGTVPVGPMLSMFDPIYVGIDEFGHPVYIKVIYKNLLAAGQPGGGKSGLMNTLTAHAALSARSRLVLFDGKRVELGMWDDIADEFVGPDLDHAIITLRRLQRVMDNRYEWLTAHRRREIRAE